MYAFFVLKYSKSHLAVSTLLQLLNSCLVFLVSVVRQQANYVNSCDKMRQGWLFTWSKM